MDQDARAITADEFEAAATALERAAAHLRTAAQHFRDHEVPRGCAHAFAALGHVHEAQDGIARRAVEHAARSTP